MPNELMQLDAEELNQPKRPWWQPLVASLVGGTLGAALWRKHPVLAALLGLTAGRNVYAVVTKESDWQLGARRVGEQCIAVAGALALPKHPVIGYVAGAAAGDVLIDGKGGGLLERWVKVAKSELPTTTALVKKEQ